MVRSTFTTTVLSPLSETTTPSRIRLGISFSLSRGLGAQHGLDPRDILADLVDAVGLLDLTRGGLEAQVELLLLQADQRVGQLVGGHAPDVSDLHEPQASMATPASMRVTTRVRIGSLAAPRRRASRAISSGTPSISNMMRPGATRAAQ